METWGFVSVGISIFKVGWCLLQPSGCDKKFIHSCSTAAITREAASSCCQDTVLSDNLITGCSCSTSYTLKDCPVLVFYDISRVPSKGKVVTCRQQCATLLSQFLCCCSLIIPRLVTCMHDRQCQPHGKALMISLPSLSEKWLHCLNAEHFICYENDVQCVFDTAGCLISLD